MSVELSLIISIVNKLEKLITMMAKKKRKKENTCPQNSIFLLKFEEMASTFKKKNPHKHSNILEMLQV